MEGYRKAEEVFLAALGTRIRSKSYNADFDFDIPEPVKIAVLPETFGTLIDVLMDWRIGTTEERLDTIGNAAGERNGITGAVTLAYTNSVHDFAAAPEAIWVKEVSGGLDIALQYGTPPDAGIDRKSYAGAYLVTWEYEAPDNAGL